MKDNLLINLEQQALEKQRNRESKGALALWLELARLDPNWEHGMVYHEISGCFEELGDHQQARSNLEKALSIEPENEVFIGAKASFEYLHGDPNEALELFLQLAHTYRNQRARVDQIKLPIYELANRIGLKELVVEQMLEKALQNTRE